jgi:hypothetical protein
VMLVSNELRVLMRFDACFALDHSLNSAVVKVLGDCLRLLDS